MKKEEAVFNFNFIEFVSRKIIKKEKKRRKLEQKTGRCPNCYSTPINISKVVIIIIVIEVVIQIVIIII